MNKILIVDSSLQNTDLMSQCLQQVDYEILTSESGRNALAKVSEYSPDLAIIDVDLPDISGYDICKHIKQNEQTQFILILLMSISDSKDLRLRAIQVGADDFTKKTFDAFILISKVNSLLRVKHLSNQLKLKYTELEEKNNLIAFQLKMARDVQRSLISEFNFKFNNAQFISKYLPALAIGGDFYDIIKINKNCIYVIIGDVSGHGISAALLTSMLNMMLKNLVTHYYNPDQLLFHMNNEFVKVFSNTGNEMYACVFCSVIDTNEKKIYYSNAGQSLPVLVSSSRNQTFELESSGIPIGLIGDSLYEFKVANYENDDIILFYTDGLQNDAYKDSHEDFASKLRQTLLAAKSLKAPEEMIDMVLAEFYNTNLHESKKHQNDDVSVILCKL